MTAKDISFNFIELAPCIDIEAFSLIKEDELFRKYAMDLDGSAARKFINYYNLTRIDRYGGDGSLPAEYTYEYNNISREPQRKILTIGINNDVVILVMKRVQMFSAVYNRIEGLPISMDDNRDNELAVIKSLSENELAWKIGGNDQEKDILDNLGLEPSDNIDTYNFYAHIPTNFEKVGKNKWRTKKGVNRLLKIENLTWEVADSYSPKHVQDMHFINSTYAAHKVEVEDEEVYSRLGSAIKEHSYWTDPNVKYFMYYYKDVPVGMCVYTFPTPNIAHQIVNKGLGRMLIENEFNFTDQERNEFDEISRRLGQFNHYITMKDLNNLGVEHVYFGGVFRKQSLRVFKTILSDKKITHNIYKLH